MMLEASLLPLGADSKTNCIRCVSQFVLPFVPCAGHHPVFDLSLFLVWSFVMPLFNTRLPYYCSKGRTGFSRRVFVSYRDLSSLMPCPCWYMPPCRCHKNRRIYCFRLLCSFLLLHATEQGTSLKAGSRSVQNGGKYCC